MPTREKLTKELAQRQDDELVVYAEHLFPGYADLYPTPLGSYREELLQKMLNRADTNVSAKTTLCRDLKLPTDAEEEAERDEKLVRAVNSCRFAAWCAGLCALVAVVLALIAVLKG